MSRALAFLIVALAAVPALAAEEGGSASPIPGIKEGIAPMVTALVVFAVVLAVLSKTAWPKISKGLDERAEKIKDEIAAAEAARKQAKDALDQYERSLADARAEAQRMLEKTKAEQQALANDLRAKADAELSALKDRARKDIEAAKRDALAEIYAAAADLSTSIASKILRREVTPRDQQRLVEESLAELNSARN
ncbi:MAG: F0F1 ATP synthase subunit B [Phycisphaerae bacterium]|nr:F0F1 ATP synthase subunit B [Phycisphaerae bacterium]